MEMPKPTVPEETSILIYLSSSDILIFPSSKAGQVMSAEF
jgi:hypothetical protein